MKGLMCIPPVLEEAAMHFALLKTLSDRHELAKPSMGMSGDYEEAIGFGATHVRYGFSPVWSAYPIGCGPHKAQSGGID